MHTSSVSFRSPTLPMPMQSTAECGLLTDPVPRSSPSELPLPRPCWIGSGADTLFGWLHQPIPGMQQDEAILLCSPLGFEQLHSHRSLRVLAQMLAAEGYPVLRFDWHGTGDSAGDDLAAERVTHWLQDIETTIGWLREQSGCERISLIGLRAGALLAAAAASRRETPIERMLLWAPVVRGKQYVRELRAIDRTAEAPRDPRPSDQIIEAGGFRMTVATAEQLSQLDLTALSPNCRELIIAQRDDLPLPADVTDWIASRGESVRRIVATETQAMLAEPHRTRIPVQTLSAIVACWSDATLPSAGECGLDPDVIENSTAVSNRMTGQISRLQRQLEQLESTGETVSAGSPDALDQTVRSTPFQSCTFSESREADRTSAENGPHSNQRPPILETQFDGLRKQSWIINRSPHLFGILTESAERPSRPVTVILLNAGAAAHIGPGRMTVELARLLARDQFRVLRVDLCGLGDSLASAADSDHDPYPETAFRDLNLIVSAVLQRFPQDRIILAGLCSGAYAAFQAATQLPQSQLAECLLINPLTFYWRNGMTIDTAPSLEFIRQQYYWRSLFDREKWLRLVTGRSRIGLAGAARLLLQRARSVVHRFRDRLFPHRSPAAADNLPASLSTTTNSASADRSTCGLCDFQGGHPRRQNLSADLKQIASQDRFIRMFFATSDPGYPLLMHQAAQTVRKMRRSGRLSIEFLDQADHTFSRDHARQRLFDAIRSALNATYGETKADG